MAVNCDIQGEVGFRVLLDSVDAGSTMVSWWSPVLQGVAVNI